MAGRLRMGFVLLVVAAGTIPLALAQIFVLRTGLFDERIAPRLWHRMIVRMLGFRIAVRGELAAGRPLLIASNHVSWSDIMVLGSIADVHFIARADMMRWPVMGWLSKLQRTVFVDRERKRASRDQAREIAARLRSGDPMVLFAEGTTGDGNGVLPFKSTLFGAAQMALEEMPEESVLVQPVAIAYTRVYGIPMSRRERSRVAWIGTTDLFAHVKVLFSLGRIDVEVIFGEPLTFSEDGDRKKIARQSEKRVREMLSSAVRGGTAK